MLESYKLKQESFYKFVTKVKENNKISHAYLIETNGVSYGFDLACDMARYFLADFSVAKDYEFDLVVIDNVVDEIKKEQVIQLQKQFMTKPIYGKYKIYIVKDASLLNKSSSNAILKFLEEPEEGIIAILLVNNINNVMETIVSRCQIISLIPESNNVKNLFIPYCNNNFEIDEFYEKKMVEIVNFYEKLEQLGTKMIVYKNNYFDLDYLSLFLQVGVHFYFDILMMLLGQDNFYISDFLVIKNNIMKNNNIDDIISKIDILNQFILNVNYNVNKDLFVDNFIITFSGGVSND